VLNEDDGHAQIGGEGFEELCEGFEAAGGGADADDGEGGGGLGGFDRIRLMVGGAGLGWR
jgi:hypothetical protein